MWGLDQNGYGNLYQAATVRSMLLNWHNYFYVSFDPAGFLSVDKPPVAFWFEAACAKLLGFGGFSMILPQALEGVAAVALIYHLVRGQFGGEAALLASLALAIMPVSVAVDRSNYADSCLVLVLMMATWAVSLAAERGSLPLLLTSAALLGIAFNTKMLVAFGVLPAFFLVYLLGAPLARRTRLRHLVASFAVLMVVSASWGLVVDLTPPDRRPYVASSQNNSVLGLAIGYNGLERVLGLGGTSQPSPIANYIPGDGREGMPGFGGMPGPWRLANRELAGQITWLIPLAVIGSIAAAVRTRPHWPLEPRHFAILLWGGWLGSYAVVFSGSRGIIHPYYLSVIALAGRGVVRDRSGRPSGGTRPGPLGEHYPADRPDPNGDVAKPCPDRSSRLADPVAAMDRGRALGLRRGAHRIAPSRATMGLGSLSRTSIARRRVPLLASGPCGLVAHACHGPGQSHDSRRGPIAAHRYGGTRATSHESRGDHAPGQLSPGAS